MKIIMNTSMFSQARDKLPLTTNKAASANIIRANDNNYIDILNCVI